MPGRRSPRARYDEPPRKIARYASSDGFLGQRIRPPASTSCADEKADGEHVAEREDHLSAISTGKEALTICSADSAPSPQAGRPDGGCSSTSREPPWIAAEVVCSTPSVDTFSTTAWLMALAWTISAVPTSPRNSPTAAAITPVAHAMLGEEGRSVPGLRRSGPRPAARR